MNKFNNHTDLEPGHYCLASRISLHGVSKFERSVNITVKKNPKFLGCIILYNCIMMCFELDLFSWTNKLFFHGIAKTRCTTGSYTCHWALMG